MARDAVNATTARRRAQREYLARHPSYNNSLWILTPKNPIRRMCQKLVGPGRGSERFDGVEPNKIAWYIFSVIIYAAIVAMVVLACVATPLYQKERMDEQPDAPPTSFWWVWTDAAFTLIFLVEAIIKVIADGAFLTPNAYYRSSWGVIDGVVLISLLINVGGVIAQDGEVSRAIGAFKALRALRLLNISDSTRDTFHSLIIVGGWKLIGVSGADRDSGDHVLTLVGFLRVTFAAHPVRHLWAEPLQRPHGQVQRRLWRIARSPGRLPWRV
jgi:hypothetical protein